MEDTKKSSEYFYCYSHRLSLFLRAFGIRYILRDKNPKTDCVYYMFPKSDYLNKMITLWNNIKGLAEFKKSEVT